MNKYLVLLVLLAFARQANAVCAANASGVIGSCLCNQGYYGSNAENGGSCTQCPAGSTTAAPSIANGGNTNSSVDVSVCNLCQLNYYMTTAAAAANGGTPASGASCSQCTGGSGNTVNQSSAGDASQCNTCKANYYMTAVASGSSAATCSACTNGSGNTGVNSAGNASQCNICKPNYYMSTAASGTSAATCVQCPGNSGNLTGATSAGDASQCNGCLPNFYMTALPATGSAATCSACPQYTFSYFNTQIGFCTCYDPNAQPLTAQNQTCQCYVGYSGTPAQTAGAPSGCLVCLSGWYSPGAGAACIQCPPGASATANQGACVCNDNSTGTIPWSSSTNVCQCQANYYGDFSQALTYGVTGTCTPCPAGSSSAIGAAKQLTDCIGASSVVSSGSTSTTGTSSGSTGSYILTFVSLLLSCYLII
ncbi:immobilization antigen (macronuclear) [Tetrahymena thermophila SB210]|uniref:Immobilization antigen n=1 Tax=Tetrahymena thermophila (strain SB210) TaxID=312017 RepID=Q22PF4_TETTS|nr:immobilization antigen [Tetrahymena thermophila SB210]EAR87155.1 immobilization antigen [Tetrahymena thermophila SB210]|eukprot:XP_001007400.1 immobilization antigen [Tetrahymena thermophila SB210]